MEQPQNDIALYNRVKKNDRLALNTLFAQYYDKLCHFAHNLLKNTEEAEEVVADIFVTLWQNRHQLQIEKSFRSYIYTSVRHKCLFLLKERKIFFTEIDEEIENTLPEINNPELILSFIELKDQMEVLVNSLPPRCRQIFILNRYDGLKYKEISDVLGISEKTVENQLVHALSFLRAHIYRIPKSGNILLT